MRLRRIQNPAARLSPLAWQPPPRGGHEVQGLRLAAASALLVKIELRGLVAQVRSAQASRSPPMPSLLYILTL